MAETKKAAGSRHLTKHDAEKKLSDKQMAFVVEFLACNNATQAAIRAGYSPRSAKQIGSEKLKNPIIAEKIRQAREAAAERNEVDRDWVLTRANNIVESPGTAVKDQLKAMDLICKLLGLFEERREDTRIEVVLGEAEEWCG